MGTFFQASDIIFRHVYMYTPIGIAIISPEDFNWIRINPALCKMLGYEEEELLQMSYLAVTHPDDVRIGVDHIFEALRSGVHSIEYEKRYIHKEGHLVWASLHVSLITNEQTNEPLYFIIQVIDITAKKAAQSKVAEQQSLFNLIAENAQDLIMYFTPDGVARYYSPSVEKLLGYKPEDIIGKNIVSFYIDELRARPLPDNDVFTCQVRHKDGHYVWLETNYKVVRDREGNIEMILGIGRDITERKQYQDNLAEAQRVAQLGSWEWDIANRKLSCSKELVRIYGQIKEDGSFDPFVACIHPEDRTRVVTQIKEATNGRPYALEYRIVLPNGAIKNVHAQGKPIFDDDHRPVRVIGIVQDITERTMMEARLWEKEKQFRLITESSRDFISRHTTDDSVTYLYASPASFSVLGYEPNELVGNSAYNYIHPDDIQSVNEYLHANLHEMRVHTVTFRIRRKDGRYVWLETTAGFTYDEETGKTKQLIAVSREITEKIEAQKALQESWERYQRLQTSLDHFSRDLFGMMHVVELEDRLVKEVMEVLGINSVCLVEVDRDNKMVKINSKTIDHHKVNEIIYHYDPTFPVCEVQDTPSGYLVTVGNTKGMNQVLVMLDTSLLPPEKIWLMTLTRYVNALYDNFRVIEDLSEDIMRRVAEQSGSSWLLRLSFNLTENERKRLSQDLHDAALQEQIMCYRKLETIATTMESSNLQKELLNISEGLLDVIHQIRLTCNELRPPMLKEFGIISSLESLFETTQRHADFEIIFDCTDFNAVLNEEKLIGIYRIVQELLANAAKHSNADTVHLTLSNRRDLVELQYRDNGIGMPPNAMTLTNMGIYGMKERVRSLEGKIAFESTLGQGLSVLVTMPVSTGAYEKYSFDCAHDEV